MTTAIATNIVALKRPKQCSCGKYHTVVELLEGCTFCKYYTLYSFNCECTSTCVVRETDIQIPEDDNWGIDWQAL
jgi:hypothetical protein